jgi:uncharacterized delta-60 repeat protein
MSAQVKVAGSWKDGAPRVKVAGSWRIVQSALVKLEGQWKSWFLQGGRLDADFANAIGTGPNSSDRLGAVVQPDGKIIVFGAFTSFNGVPAGRLIRLNSNGTVDATFNSNIGTGADTTLSSVILQADGKMVLIAEPFATIFSSFNGTSVPRLVRLNADGTIDATFLANIGTGVSETGSGTAIYGIIQQSDGKLLIGGGFTQFNGASVGRLIRLNSNGTRDTAFSATHGSGFSNIVNRTIAQPDGKIIVLGTFTSFNGITANRILRLNSDGSRDVLFSTNTGTGSSNAINNFSLGAEGKLYLSGVMSEFNGTTVPRMVRLNSDGTIDTAFLTAIGTGPLPPGGIIDMRVEPSGKIIVFGGTIPSFNGTAVPNLVRLNSDGTIDTAFLTAIGTGPSSNFFNVVLQPELDDKIIVFGGFNSFNGVSARALVRLNSDGTRDATFQQNTVALNFQGPNSIVLQKDQKLLVCRAQISPPVRFFDRIGGDVTY